MTCKHKGLYACLQMQLQLSVKSRKAIDQLYKSKPIHQKFTQKKRDLLWHRVPLLVGEKLRVTLSVDAEQQLLHMSAMYPYNFKNYKFRRYCCELHKADSCM